MMLRWLFGHAQEEDHLVVEDVDEESGSDGGEVLDMTCAWCLAKAGMTPLEGSHGICAACTAEVLQRHHERRRR